MFELRHVLLPASHRFQTTRLLSDLSQSSIYYLHRVLECQIELILDFGLFVALPTLFFGTLELATFTIDVDWNETSKLANVSFSF